MRAAARERRRPMDGRSSLGSFRDCEVDARQLDARGDPELAIDVAQVEVDRARAEEELARDVAVGAPLGDELGDLHLLRGELVERARIAPARASRRWRAARCGRARPTARAPSASKRSSAARRWVRAWARRRARRRNSPKASSVRARSNGRAGARRAASSAAAKRRSASSGSVGEQRAAVQGHGLRPTARRLLSAHGSKASSHARAASVSPARTAASMRSSASQSIARRRGQRARVRQRGLRAPEPELEHRRAPRWRSDADVDQAARGRELEALGGERAAALLLAAHGGEQRLDRDQVGADLVLARAAGELEPLGQARGGRRPVAVPEVAERHPRQRLGEQRDHAVLARPRGDAPVQLEHGAVVAQEEAHRADEAEPIGQAVGRRVRRPAPASCGSARAAASKSRVKCARRPAQARAQEAVAPACRRPRGAPRCARCATTASPSRAKAAPQLARLSR